MKNYTRSLILLATSSVVWQERETQSPAESKEFRKINGNNRVALFLLFLLKKSVYFKEYPVWLKIVSFSLFSLLFSSIVSIFYLFVI